MVALAGVQPALSRSMQRLETALQVSLFDRQKNKIELNDNGRMAVEYAGRIVGEARDMAARIQAFDRSRRTILVGSCAPAPLWEISQVLADLYPDRTIASEMRENQVLLEGLRDGVYQLIILPYPVEEAGVTCAKYGEEHLFFSLPPAPTCAASSAGSAGIRMHPQMRSDSETKKNRCREVLPCARPFVSINFVRPCLVRRLACEEKPPVLKFRHFGGMPSKCENSRPSLGAHFENR